MIVDDDRNICELLRLYIEKEGFETAIANDGKAAVQMFDSVNPDLMLLDIMLPELDGLAGLPRDPQKVPVPHHYADGQGRSVR